MHRAKYLEQANNLINGQRQEGDGTALENQNRIASLWSVYTGKEFTPVDVAMMMLLVKVARTMERPKDDSFVDI